MRSFTTLGYQSSITGSAIELDSERMDAEWKWAAQKVGGGTSHVSDMAHRTSGSPRNSLIKLRMRCRSGTVGICKQMMLERLLFLLNHVYSVVEVHPGLISERANLMS